MKKIISRVTILILLLALVLCVATQGFMNWNYKEWFKYDNNENHLEESEVKSGTYHSDKYGTFVIPEGNMFSSFGYGVVTGFPNGTDLSYINDYITKKYNKLNNTEYSNLNFAYKSYNTIDFEMLKENALKIYFNHNEYFAHFTDNILKYDTTHESAWQGFLIDTFIAVQEDFSSFPTSMDMPAPPTESIIIDAQESILSLAVRVLTRKVEVKVDNSTSMTMYVPTVIISDRGVPLTDEIYNEIMGKTI